MSKKKEVSVADSAPAELSAVLKRMEVPIEIVATKEKGKHVRALEDLKEGYELFEENPLVWWPFSAMLTSKIDYCSNCSCTSTEYFTGEKGGPYSCSDCKTAKFCCKECQTAHNGIHQTMCGLEEQLREFHFEQQLAQVEKGDNTNFPISVESLARCVGLLVHRFRRGVAQVLEVAEGEPTKELVEGKLDAGTLRSIFEASVQPFNRLVEPPTNSEFSDVNGKLWCEVVAKTLKDRVFKLVYEQQDIADVFLSHTTLNTLLGQLTLNAQCVNRDLISGAVSSIGGAVFSLHSNFNHSCAPNCEVGFSKECNEIVIKTTADVAKGDELTITYIPTLTLATESAKQRRERLEPYLFHCKCPKCVAEDEEAKVEGEKKEDE